MRALVLIVPAAVALSEKLPLSSRSVGVDENFCRKVSMTQARRARPPEGFRFQPQGIGTPGPRRFAAQVSSFRPNPSKRK